MDSLGLPNQALTEGAAVSDDKVFANNSGNSNPKPKSALSKNSLVSSKSGLKYGHSRSVSFGGVLSVHDLDLDHDPESQSGNVFLPPTKVTVSEKPTLRKHHNRFASHGGHDLNRNSPRPNFILPDDRIDRNHDHCEPEPEVNGNPEFMSIPRQASRSESTYTIQEQKVLWVHRLFFWRRNRRRGVFLLRTIVPNHSHNTVDGTPNPNMNRKFASNKIRTTKYTLISFLPKNLFEQFHRFANLYCVAIVGLNWIPQLNAFGKEIAMIPIIFILGLTAVKDLFQDLNRHRSDKGVNNSICRVYNKELDDYSEINWKHLRVGDMVHLRCNEVIPADILVLRTSDPNGLCYIQTSNLDGESNLKQKEIIRGFAGKQNIFRPQEFQSEIQVGPPTTKIDNFSGSVLHGNGTAVPVTKENLLLRDCLLKNTDFVEGIVIYAGRETKAMLNNGGPPHKRSGLEKMMNLEVIWCAVILAVLCGIGAANSRPWETFLNGTIHIMVYPPIETPYSIFDSIVISFLSFVILLQGMIPLSLYVTIELTKLMQIYHIQNDLDLYDKETNKRIQCRATNIHEDLGQIQYIFSDKTGTLTENKMIFRRCTIGKMDYNHAELDHHPSLNHFLNSPTLQINQILNRHLLQWNNRLLNSNSSDIDINSQSQLVYDFFTILAICNTVVVSKEKENLQNEANRDQDVLDDNLNSQNPRQESENHFENCETSRPEFRPIYEAESPDESVLVETAFIYNCKLLERTPTHVRVKMPNSGALEYKILHTFPFDPVRKRMSIMVEHPITNEIIFYSKGADSAIFSRLRNPRNECENFLWNQTQTNIDNYAREGLRILVMAKRILTRDFYNAWLTKYRLAELDINNRDMLISHTYIEIEKDMELVGATGIEDRLQEGVPESIEAFRKAGIVVWVLTGDKQETAINIAYSCKLFTENMDLIKLNTSSMESTEETITYYNEEIQRLKILGNSLINSANDNPNREQPQNQGPQQGSSLLNLQLFRNERALVVDGKTLKYILHPHSKLMERFLDLTRNCSAVLCCRSTPLQKAFIVTSVKNQLKMRTLAIGDGANDVPMIQSADIGIGISGKEGMQAAMASDFAISKFQYLKRLLLVHGHWSSDRLTRMILYFFYKNAAFAFVIFWCQILHGSVMIDEMYLLAFNLFFTSLPPMAIGIYDQDAPADLLMAVPQLYRHKIRQGLSFWLNIIDAFYQSIVIFFVAYFATFDGLSESKASEFGTTLCIASMYVMLAHMALESKSWTIIHILTVLLSITIFYTFAIIYNSTTLPTITTHLENPIMIISELISSPEHWLTILAITVLAILPRFATRVLVNTLYPSEVTKAKLIKRRHHEDNEIYVTHF